MRLYLLRHGNAEEQQAGHADRDRRLTPEGIAEVEAEAAALRRLRLGLDLILSSPYPRALQTAEIVARALDLTAQLRSDTRLASGCRFGTFQEIVAEHPEVRRLMLVGHNPDLSLTATRLLGGTGIELKKGGLIRIDLDRFEPGQGTLRWLVTPALLIGSSPE
jgi:phosphohistidine phosphatase